MIHLVYPHGSRISTPDAIGRHLGAFLRERGHSVVNHDWSARYRIEPARGDILLGHPHPWPDTVFRRSFSDSRWARRYLLCPYAHGLWRQIDWMDSLVCRSDGFLAITGPYWRDTILTSRFAHWAPRMTQLDLAIDLDDFPRTKMHFNNSGMRKFVYIGHTDRAKNTSYLSRLARALPPGTLAHIGGGKISGCLELGIVDFRDEQARLQLKAFDFMLTVGRSDANPTTILEAMAWGLLPVCTPQSGYADVPSIPNIPLDDVPQGLARIGELQSAPTTTLEDWRSHNYELLASHFTWERFGYQVLSAIEDSALPGSISPPRLGRRVSLMLGSIACRYGLVHPRNLLRWIQQTPQRWRMPSPQ